MNIICMEIFARGSRPGSCDIHVWRACCHFCVHVTTLGARWCRWACFHTAATSDSVLCNLSTLLSSLCNCWPSVLGEVIHWLPPESFMITDLHQTLLHEHLDKVFLQLWDDPLLTTPVQSQPDRQVLFILNSCADIYIYDLVTTISCCVRHIGRVQLNQIMAAILLLLFSHHIYCF